jgi:hypothetical protein
LKPTAKVSRRYRGEDLLQTASANFRAWREEMAKLQKQG